MKYKYAFFLLLLLLLLANPLKASNGGAHLPLSNQNDLAFQSIEKLLSNEGRDEDLQIAVDYVEKDSRVVSSATEQEIVDKAENAVQKIELRSTTIGTVFLEQLSENQEVQDSSRFGYIYIEFIMGHPQSEDRYPVEINYGFMMPEGDYIAATARRIVTAKSIDQVVTSELKTVLSMQLVASLLPKFQELKHARADLFKEHLSQFIFSYINELLAMNEGILDAMIREYPDAAKKVLEEAQKLQINYVNEKEVSGEGQDE